MKSIKLESIEIGHGFLSIWSPEYPALREFGKELYKKLPEELKAINQEDLWFHSPPLFHPYGQGPECGRKQYKHLHILYPRTPTDEDVRELYVILGRPQNLKIENLEDHKDPKIDADKALKRSLQIYKKIMEKHK